MFVKNSYVPGMALVLGWPVMVEQVLDGRM